jgi:hypothetical protein
MNASKMMAKITTTNQKKNTTMPGMAYPATVLALATTASYPQPFDLFGDGTQGILAVSEQTDEAHLHAAWLGVQIWLSCASPQAKLAQASGIPIRRSFLVIPRRKSLCVNVARRVAGIWLARP